MKYLETRIVPQTNGTFGVEARSIKYDGARGHWMAYENFPTEAEANVAASKLGGEDEQS